MNFRKRRALGAFKFLRCAKSHVIQLALTAGAQFIGLTIGFCARLSNHVVGGGAGLFKALLKFALRGLGFGLRGFGGANFAQDFFITGIKRLGDFGPHNKCECSKGHQEHHNGAEGWKQFKAQRTFGGGFIGKNKNIHKNLSSEMQSQRDHRRDYGSARRPTRNFFRADPRLINYLTKPMSKPTTTAKSATPSTRAAVKII